MPDTFKIHKESYDQNQTIFYTTMEDKSQLDNNGFPVTLDENSACAKKTYNQGTTKTRHFIKVDSYGRAYNPIGMYSENQINKFSARAGKKIYTFKEVNDKVFNYYINFLRTKNQALLRNTEREMEWIIILSNMQYII